MIQKNEALDVLLDDLLPGMEKGVAKGEFIKLSEALTIPEMVHIMERCIAGEVKGYNGDARGFSIKHRQYAILLLNRRLTRGDISEQELWKAFFRKMNSVICHESCEFDKIHDLLIKINRQGIVYRLGDRDEEFTGLCDYEAAKYLKMIVKCVDRVTHKTDACFKESIFWDDDENYWLEVLEKDAITKSQIDDVIEYVLGHGCFLKAIPALLLKKYGQWPDAQEERAIKKKMFMVQNPYKKTPKEGE